MEVLTSEVPLKKKRTEARSSNLEGSCRQAPVSLLSSTELILQIPPSTKTSFPVWEHVRANQVEVMWSVAPYSITVRITPLPSQKAHSKALLPTQPSSLPVPSTQPSTDLPVPASLPLPSTQTLPQTIPGAPIIQSAPRVQSTPHPCGFILSHPQLLLPSHTQSVPQSQSFPQLAPPCQELFTYPSDGTQLLPDLPPLFSQLAAKTFYTQSSGDIHICDRFLTGRCRSKLKCNLHHTPYPFHWQLRYQNTQQWVSASVSAQVHLEKLYCDEDKETIGLLDKNDHFTLNFDTMTVVNSEKYDKMRRLSNTSSPARNPYFPTEWKIYWYNDYAVWEEYSKELSTRLLDKMEAGETSSWFHIGKQEYEADFSSLTQMNLTTGCIRRVRRRPTFRSPSSLKSHLKTAVLVGTAEPVGQVLPSLSVDPLQDFSSWYPPVWTLSPDQSVSLVEVPPSTKAYQSIYSLFYSTMPETKLEIVSIEQVQNIFQWDKYRRQKEHMHSRSTGQSGSLEQHLFHGTTEDSAKEICWNNFDPRVSGKNGVAYGRGSYFARDPRYSLKYAPTSGEGGCKHMFLAKVLVGKMSVGKTEYCRPPYLNPQMPGFERYDTCVNQCVNPATFVVFDSCQCYPYYLIKYKAVSHIVNIS